MVRLKAGTYAMYRGLLLECSIDGGRVIIHTTNDLIAMLLGQLPSKWRRKPYEVVVPIVKLKLLFTIKREFLFKGEYYPLMNETADVINVRIPMSIIEREGIKEYDPRDPIVTFQKTGNETIRETKTVLHPVRDTQIRIIGPAGGRTDGQEAETTDDRKNEPKN